MNRNDMDPQLNRVDMQGDGTRSCYLHSYPGSGWEAKAESAATAWGATDRYLLEGNPVGIREASYLLRFPDGLWRWASFGSSAGGTPMGYCSAEGYPGENGAIADQNRQIAVITTAIQSHDDQAAALERHRVLVMRTHDDLIAAYNKTQEPADGEPAPV